MSKSKFRIASAIFAGLVALGTATAASAQNYNWSGLYLGAQAGFGIGTAKATNDAGSTFYTSNGTTCTGPGCGFDFKPSGAFGGGQIGYQVQSGAWVFGGEVSVLGTGISKSIVSPYFASLNNTEKMSIDSLALFDGKLGYAQGNWLTYAKAGVAIGTTKFTADAPLTPSTLIITSRHTGLTLGAGIDYRLDKAWTLGADYNYVNLANHSDDGVRSGGTIPATYSSSANAHLFGLRLNYLFGQ